jgi:mevalonate kinase
VLDSFCESRQDFRDLDETLRPAQKSAFQALLFLYLGIFEEVTPLRFEIETDLPVGAGLGSSASFAVALAGGTLLAAGREPRVGFNVDTVRIAPTKSF